MVLRKAQDTSQISRVNAKPSSVSQASNAAAMASNGMNNQNSSAANLNNFLNIQSTNEQPSVKRQRIENTADSDEISASTSSLDDSGNSSSSSSSSSLIFSENELKTTSNNNNNNNKIIISNNDSNSVTSKISNLREPKDITDALKFQNALSKQCLCGMEEKLLKKQFLYYKVKPPNSLVQYSSDSEDEGEVQNISQTQESQSFYIKSLKSWPDDYLIKFLSNLQLLFDVYLKQNAKGSVCKSILELCKIIRRENHIFEELFEFTCNQNSNRYLSYMACKVLTSFLIITKDEKDHNQEWLKKIINNIFSFDNLDYAAVKRINSSLDIIKEIVEWKDLDDEHPLDDDRDGFTSLQPPPLETNYFATHYNYPTSSHGASSSSAVLPSYLASTSGRSSATSGHGSPIGSHDGCQICHVTDSESYDTTQIKCDTIKFLENKWPALVKNISSLITQTSLPANPRQQSRYSNANLQNPHFMSNAECCILTFITLWESIISVKANLSVIETLPFYVHLINFELLLNQNLSSLIYKQMLQLFNEALCYGSTLALQDLLPEETCSLAHQIVRRVKDYRILESMPRQTCYGDKADSNLTTLIGLNCRRVSYAPQSFDHQIPSVHSSIDLGHPSVVFDKSLLQKMTLLVLKSVAVTVKEIRCDSSDSSIDSTDYEAFQEMMLIERSIRDVLRKLESFMKNTLDFHPETHFSKILIKLFDDQDDHLIEAMVCTLDVTSGISFKNNAFPELVAMLNPVYTFLEFLKMISNNYDVLLDYLVSNETCFLLYLLRFLKYIRQNWSMFIQSCHTSEISNNCLEDTMATLCRLRYKISQLVSKSLYPYDIAPILRLLETCENLYEGCDLS